MKHTHIRTRAHGTPSRDAIVVSVAVVVRRKIFNYLKSNIDCATSFTNDGSAVLGA